MSPSVPSVPSVPGPRELNKEAHTEYFGRDFDSPRLELELEMEIEVDMESASISDT